jgi:membrane-associated phospholipid phosphatase
MEVSTLARHALSSITLAGMLTTSLPGQGSLAVERSGDYLQIALPTAAGASTLLLKDLVGFRQFAVSFIVGQAVTHILKRTINRKRPDGGRYAFPSAHTSAAFGGSAFVHMRYGMKWAWPMHLAATFVGYSRLTSDKHWISDVLGGAALAFSTCLIFVRRRKRGPDGPTHRPNLAMLLWLFLP